MYAKFVYEQEIRLMKLESPKVFEELNSSLPVIFKTKLPSPFSLFFLDDSNDLISIATYEDLEFLGKNYKIPLKLFIKSADVPQQPLENIKKSNSFDEISEEKKESENPNMNKTKKLPEDIIFHGIQCDGCNKKPIYNVRYKCLSCDNYDLCSECEGKNIHSNHVFAKFKSPEQTINKEIPQCNPFDLIKMAQPFIKEIIEKKKCNFKQWSNESKCHETKKEDEKNINKTIEEIAHKVTEIIGGKFEDNIELVKGFKENLDLTYILNVLSKN